MLLGTRPRGGAPVVYMPRPEVTFVGNRPTMETRQQVEASGLLQKLVAKSSAIYADGNPNWKSAAVQLGLKRDEVTHQLKQFRKTVRSGAVMLSCVAGNQILDCTWGDLKTFLPSRLAAKVTVTGHSQLHPNVQLLVNQWNFSTSIGSTTPQEFLTAPESLL